MELEFLVAKYNYWIFILLLVIGLFGLLVKKNLIKKVIALTIFQNAIILFYISISFKKNATIPIIEHHGHEALEHINPAHYASPLGQVLMLTAIVVGVATLGVALSLIQKIYRVYGTIEENEISNIIEQHH